ncbi:MAG: glycosyl transferase [Bacteroidetes bacterium GWA2_32_17]|nr:MAG: glycosyl transferase [Bacteroidetes bacterium GWA2_32_17]
MKIIFWLLFAFVLYEYIGYALLLIILVFFKKLFISNKIEGNTNLPDVTLFVTAYNEKDYIESKVENSFSLNYPANKLHFLWVTDGSDDGTPELLSKYKEIEVLHNTERAGKINAMNRGMKYVKTPIVIFCDANTLLSKDSVIEIVNAFKNPKVGCVAGEKKIVNKDSDTAAGSGEGIYWKYESLLKKLDSELHTTVGAAGELFAIRTELFNDVEPDTLLDDFILSMRIAINGYKIKYVPKAYATEKSSANINEELKRKIRIAAGAVQSFFRLTTALNPFHDILLAFQFFSHKVLRWLITPFILPFVLLLNVHIVVFSNNSNIIYFVILLLQIIFYMLAFVGWAIRNSKIRLKLVFVPYYIFMMNYASWLGLFRYLSGKQSVNWERAKRAM